MDKLKNDTLKVGDTFKISYTPRTHNSEIIDVVDEFQSVSYTHLTLPTNREV